MKMKIYIFKSEKSPTSLYFKVSPKLLNYQTQSRFLFCLSFKVVRTSLDA